MFPPSFATYATGWPFASYKVSSIGTILLMHGLFAGATLWITKFSSRAFHPGRRPFARLQLGTPQETDFLAR